jgi:hypothetical protein
MVNERAVSNVTKKNSFGNQKIPTTNIEREQEMANHIMGYKRQKIEHQEQKLIAPGPSNNMLN